MHISLTQHGKNLNDNPQIRNQAVASSLNPFRIEKMNQSDLISVPGVYSGYTEVVANGYEKTAVYVSMRDGCRIATDIYRPTMNGLFLEGRLPTVCISTGYRRSFVLKRGEQFRDRYFPQFEYGDVVSWGDSRCQAHGPPYRKVAGACR